MLFWHVPKPNEAILISGSKHRDPGGPQFRIVTGHGCFVLPDQAAGQHPVSGSARSGDRRGVRQQAGHPPADARRRGVQGGRRPAVDRQRRPSLPERAEPHGGAGRAHLLRSPALHRRGSDGGGDHPGAGPGVPGDQGRQPPGDGEAGPRRRQPPDPGGGGHERLHQQPGRPPRGGGGQSGPHRPGRVRSGRGRAEQEAERNKAEYERQTRVAQAGYKAQVDEAQAQAAQAGPLFAGPGHPTGHRRADRPGRARRPAWPPSGWSPRSRSPPTPRPTRCASWPKPSATPCGCGPRVSAAATSSCWPPACWSTSSPSWWPGRRRRWKAPTWSSSTAPRASARSSPGSPGRAWPSSTCCARAWVSRGATRPSGADDAADDRRDAPARASLPRSGTDGDGQPRS